MLPSLRQGSSTGSTPRCGIGRFLARAHNPLLCVFDSRSRHNAHPFPSGVEHWSHRLGTVRSPPVRSRHLTGQNQGGVVKLPQLFVECPGCGDRIQVTIHGGRPHRDGDQAVVTLTPEIAKHACAT